MSVLSCDLDRDDVASRSESDCPVLVGYSTELNDVACFRMVRRRRYGRLCDIAGDLCRVLEGRGVEGTEINAAKGEAAEDSVRRRYFLAEDLR